MRILGVFGVLCQSWNLGGVKEQGKWEKWDEFLTSCINIFLKRNRETYFFYIIIAI
jgi:hypothetical protein